MQFSTKTLLALLAFAIPIMAQDDSACDPQNNDNNDATCTGSLAQTTAMTSSGLTGRLSLVSNTVTDTNVIIQESTDVVVGTTSLPKSLYTGTTRNTIVATTVVSGTYVYTSSYDPNSASAASASMSSSTSDGAAAGMTAAALPGAAIAALGFAAALL